MKKFKVKYSSLVWVLMSIVIAVCVLGFILNVFKAVKEFNNLSTTPYYKISTICLCLFCVLIAFVVACMMIKSEYVFTDKHIILRLGILNSKIEYLDITGFVHYTKKRTLALATKDEKVSYVLINEQHFGDFIAQTKNRNSEVFVSIEQE